MVLALRKKTHKRTKKPWLLMERALAWYERSVFRKIILTENSLRAGETACHIRALSCCRVLIYAAIYVIFVVLLDAQVTLCDGERGMVKDDHDHDRIAALFPRVVAEGLAQGMAADVSLDADRVRGGSDHAVRLRARDRGARLFGTREEKGIPVPVHFGFYQFLAVSCERGPRLMIQRIRFSFPVFCSLIVMCSCTLLSR